MKIIAESNFDKETVSDILIAENVCDSHAKEITEFLNKKYSSETSTYYYSVKPDNYQLKIFKP